MEFQYISEYVLQCTRLTLLTLKLFYKSSAPSETFRAPNKMSHLAIGTLLKQ